jgi:hypothetical protein
MGPVSSLDQCSKHSHSRDLGRPDPIPFTVKNDQMGLGKANFDFAMIDATVAQRRDLASERQTRETNEQRQNREVSFFP